MSDFTPLTGWAGADHPELLREAFDLWGDSFIEFRIAGDGGDKPPAVRLWDYTRKLLGKDTPNYAQEIGDCVSFGMKNACNYVQALPILNGQLAEYHETFPPYFYGISRVQIGGGRIWGDGSLGNWAAAGVLKYGVLRNDFTGVPGYAGSVAKSWGKSGPPSQFITEAQKFLVKSAAKVTTVDQAMEAIKNGYPVTVASNRGFKMTAGSDGFHAPSGTWNHQMCIIMCDSGGDGVEPHFGILNSWGDAHGQVKDFRDPSNVWPVGMLRAKASVVGTMLAQDDSFAVSPFELFPAQKLPRTAFDPW